MQTREFHLGDILSITTGVLVSPRKMKGVYDILQFMTGRSLSTHQLPRSGDEMTPRLLAQHPQLAAVNADSVNVENHAAWLAEQIALYGETMPVRAEHQFHEQRDSIEEAEEQFGKDRAIQVVL